MKQAYSLIEILVVMAVFAILAAIGIGSLTSFRDGAQFRSATLEYEKVIEEVRNLARNNVVSRSNSVDPTTRPETSFNVQIAGYYLDLQPDTPLYPGQPFRLYSCRDGNFDNIPPNNPSPDEIRCNTPEDWLLVNRENFRRINTTLDGCEGIFFRNASSDLYLQEDIIIDQPVAKSDFDPLTATDDCEVTLEHQNRNNRNATYIIDEEGNRFYRD